MNEHSEVSSVQPGDRDVPPVNPRAVLLLEKSEWEDALEDYLPSQRRRLFAGAFCIVISTGFGLAGLLDHPVWFVPAGLFILPTLFGLGWFLMTQQEINRLKGRISEYEEEILRLDEDNSVVEES
jgi:hypothetical protein